MRGWVGWRQQKPRGLFGTDGMTAWEEAGARVRIRIREFTPQKSRTAR